MGRTIRTDSILWSIHFSPKGTYVYAFSLEGNFFARPGDAHARRLLPDALYITPHPDDRHVAFTNREIIGIADLSRGGKVVASRPQPPPEPGRTVGDARGVLFSPDGRRLAYAQPASPVLDVWSPATKQTKRVAGWYRDVKRFVRGEVQRVNPVLWRGDKGVLLTLTYADSHAIQSLVLWVDVDHDRLGSPVRVWHSGHLTPDSVLHDGRFLVSDFDPDKKRVWLERVDAWSGNKTRLFTHPRLLRAGHDEFLGFSAARDAGYAAVFGAINTYPPTSDDRRKDRTYNAFIWVVDTKTGATRTVTQGAHYAPGKDESDPLVRAALSPDGRKVAFIGLDAPQQIVIRRL